MNEDESARRSGSGANGGWWRRGRFSWRQYRTEERAAIGRLRTECPVYRSGSRYLLTRYDDVAAVLRDPRFSVKRPARVRSADSAQVGPTSARMRAMMAFRGRQMLEADPPDHTRLRALANHAFAARTIVAMQRAHPAPRGRPPRPGGDAGRDGCDRRPRPSPARHRDRRTARRAARGPRPHPSLVGGSNPLPGRLPQPDRCGGGVAGLRRLSARRSSPPAAPRRATTCSPRSSMPRRAAADWMRRSCSRCASSC